MQLINSQYRLKEIIEERKSGSIYLVEDIYKNNILKKMHIIENTSESSAFIEYMKINFFDYINIIHPNMVKFYYFNRIRVINTELVVSNKFYFTYEYFDGENLFDYVKGKSKDEILGLCVQVLSVFKYLHLRGFVLCNINENDIYIVTDKGERHVKISAFPYAMNIDNSIILNKDNAYFKSPEAMQSKQYDIISDIYLFGVIMHQMFFGINIDESAFKIKKPDYTDNFLSNIIKIIEKCTAFDKSARYSTTDEILSDINRVFNKSFAIVDKEYIEILPMYSTKLVARERYLKKLLKKIRGYFYEEKSIKLSTIIGKAGSGKGVFINLLINRLKIEGEHVIYAVLNEDSTLEYNGIRQIIKAALKYSSKELIDKYIEQLCILIPELAAKKEIDSPIISEKQSESYKLIYRLGNYIAETSLERSFVIIIKNYDYIDEESKKIINYLITCKSKIYFVFSYKDKIEDKKIIDSFKPALEDSQIDIEELSNFNIYETAEAIRILLGMNKPPIDFATKVFNATEGNPHLVYEIIYEAFQQKFIYVDDKGNWVLNKADLTKVYMPLSIDEFSLKKIYKLEPTKRKALDIVSIFNTPVGIDTLSNMADIDLNEASIVLENLVNLNILSRRMDDWGITYDFLSMALKKTIYNKMDSYTLSKHHEKASMVLEKKYTAENRMNKDELIYQMSKSGRDMEAIDYLIKSSNEMIAKRLYSQAILFLKQANELLINKDPCIKAVEVTIGLGDLYYRIGKYNKCLNYYIIAKSNASMLKNDKSTVDIYIKKINVYYKLHNVRKCLECSRLAKEKIKAINYTEGMLDLIIALSDLIIFKRKPACLAKIAENKLKVIDKSNKYYYGAMLAIYGKALCNTFNYRKAISILNESVEILCEIPETEALASALNSIGIVYAEYFYNAEKAKEYFIKTLEISKRINSISYMMRGYNNIGDMYREEDLLKKSRIYLNKAMKMANRYPDAYTETILYLNCAMIGLETEKFKEYKHYIKRAESIIFDNKKSGKGISFYYIYSSIFYYLMGMYEEALSSVEKSKNLSKARNCEIDSDVSLVEVLCEIRTTGKMNPMELRELCLSIYKTGNHKVSRMACHKIAEIYIDNKKYDEARDLLEFSKEIKKYKDTEHMNIIYSYLSAMASEDGRRLQLLINLLSSIEGFRSNEIKWRIYKAIGLELRKGGDLYGALKNLLTSFNHLRILVDGVPDEHKIQFLKSHNRSTVKTELISLSEQISGEKFPDIKEITDIGEIEDVNDFINEYFQYAYFKDLIIGHNNKILDFKTSLDKNMIIKFLPMFVNTLKNFSSDLDDNIRSTVELFMNYTQAKNAFLSIIDEDSCMRMIYSNFKNKNMDFYKYITEITGQRGSSTIISDVFEYRKTTEDSLLIPVEIAALFCIPVSSNRKASSINKDRRKAVHTNNIVGYLYLDTDSVINNFTDEVGELCVMLSKAAYILIENYNLRMVNAVDKLTKLYTRKYFENALLNEISNAATKGGQFSIIMADIDRFKVVNDRFGHQVGDKVLAEMSEIMVSSLRKTDICARYGGEEFIILLPSTESNGAFYLAEKIRERIKEADYEINQSITISMGIASYPKHSTWMNDLIDKADQALYHSKENGRNLTTLYDDNLKKSVKRIDKLAGIIRGNMTEDMKNVENIIEILELQRNKDKSVEEKLSMFLGRIIEISGAQWGSIFTIDKNKKQLKQITRKDAISSEITDMPYNVELLEECIENKSGKYLIDWSGSVAMDAITGMPDWQSVMILPITNKETLNALLYLTVSLKNKEFDGNTYNFINTLCNIIAPIFIS